MEKSCHILSIYIVEKKKSWLIPHRPSGLIRKLPGKSYWIMGQRSSNRLPWMHFLYGQSMDG